MFWLNRRIWWVVSNMQSRGLPVIPVAVQTPFTLLARYCDWLAVLRDTNPLHTFDCMLNIAIFWETFTLIVQVLFISGGDSAETRFQLESVFWTLRHEHFMNRYLADVTVERRCQT